MTRVYFLIGKIKNMGLIKYISLKIEKRNPQF